MSGHIEEKKMIWNSQHGFIEGKSCLTSTIAFCNEMMDLWMREEQQISFTSTLTGLSAVSHTVFFLSKLEHYDMSSYAATLKIWLGDCAQRVVVNRSYCICRHSKKWTSAGAGFCPVSFISGLEEVIGVCSYQVCR